MMGPWRRLAYSLLLVMVAGCDCEKGCSGTAAQAPSSAAVINPQPSIRQLNIQASWMPCTEDKECAHVPSDCCGCAGGGADTAINWKHLEAAGEARAVECGSVSCTMVLSNHPTCRKDARCVGGECRLLLGAGTGPLGVGVEKIQRGEPGAAQEKVQRLPPSLQRAFSQGSATPQQ